MRDRGRRDDGGWLLRGASAGIKTRGQRVMRTKGLEDTIFGWHEDNRVKRVMRT
jgi:hypothetical protein